MEALLAELADKLPVKTLLGLLALAAGIVLLLWAIVGRQVKVWQVVLPPIAGKLKRGIVLFIAFCFIGLGVWIILQPPETPLKVLIGQTSEEYEVFEEVIKRFETEYGVEVEVDNVTWEKAITILEEEKIDLVAFDINARHELVRWGLIEELNIKGLIPSATNLTLLEHLEVNGVRYFAPYRPNVQLVFLNKEGFVEMGIDYPKTWGDVREVAQRFRERDGEARVVIHGTDEGIPLTLLQIIRSAGGNPRNLLHPQSKAALEFVRQLYPYVFPESSKVDWQRANSYLLADRVYLVRNWYFALMLIHDAGRDADFEVYSGWSWSSDSKPSNLLGGEFLALPKNARHKKEAIDLMRFLMSKEVQEKLAAELGWLPMRMDVPPPPWLQIHERAMNAALAYAEPVPDYWFPEMPVIYRRLFHEIVSLDPDAGIESTLERFQLEIDALVARPR